MKKEILRQLPSIDELINSPGLAKLAETHDRDVVVGAARVVMDEVRSDIIEGKAPLQDEISVESMSKRVALHLQAKLSPSLRHAVNASGIILHTGLGRAMLAQDAVSEINDVIRGYCTLAVDMETGQRGTRDAHLSGLLCELTGAEAATVVNNNAAATMIVLNSMAGGREVIVSRGQLVEIGGSFRMPDVMAASGAILREVGTTNKTHLRDYAAAINENTGAILKVHQSNYRIIGFAEEPPIRELAALAREHNLPIIDDLGSGALVDLRDYGLEAEPMVQESVKAGADVVCFSGDKLIGGPQCGIIVGRAEAIEKIKKNPLARALRIGKMTVAGLEATLKLFLDREHLNSRHPTYRMLSIGLEELDGRVRTVAEGLRAVPGSIQVVDGASQVGSGSVPAEALPSKLLSIRPKGMSAETLARKLRAYDPPILARIHQEAVLLDFRTIQPEEEGLVEKAIGEILHD